MIAPNSTTRPIELLLVEQRADLRLGVGRRLADSPIHVLAEATTGPAALAAIRQQRPDLVLLGHTRDTGSEESELARIRREFPRLPVLVYSEHDQPLFIAQALLGGAQGYLLHSLSDNALVEAIALAAAGGCCWTAEQITPIAGPAHDALPSTASASFPLTTLEREVLWRVAEGLSDHEVALRLELPASTVYGVYRSLWRKLAAMRRLWTSPR